jgi:hypothetical protein
MSSIPNNKSESFIRVDSAGDLLLTLVFKYSNSKVLWASAPVKIINSVAEHIADELEKSISGKTIERLIKAVKGNTINMIPESNSNNILCEYVVGKLQTLEEKININNVLPAFKFNKEKSYVNLINEFYATNIQSLTSPSGQKLLGHNIEQSEWRVFVAVQENKIAIRHLKVGRFHGFKGKAEYLLNDPTLLNYVGEIELDKSGHFTIINLRTIDSEEKHLHIKTKLAPGTAPQIMLGIITYINHDLALLSCLTVFQKINEKTPAITGIFSQKSKKIPGAIRDFLAIQKRKTLLVKSKVVIELKDLKGKGKATTVKPLKRK